MVVMLSWLLVAAATVHGSGIVPRTSTDPLTSCPGYKASNVKTTASSLTADLSLAGAACNVYGDDLTSLTLEVVYETGKQAYPPKTKNLTEITQTTAFTSRSKILPMASIRFRPVCSHGHRPRQGSISKAPTSNSTMSPHPSPSPSRAPRPEKCCSILPPQVSFSKPNTSD